MKDRIYYQDVTKNHLLNQYPLIGEGTNYGTDGSIAISDLVVLPKINLGGFEIYNMPVFLTQTKFESSIPTLIGGDLLKRFNIILDFRKKLVYLKPNRNINTMF